MTNFDENQVGDIKKKTPHVGSLPANTAAS